MGQHASVPHESGWQMAGPACGFGGCFVLIGLTWDPWKTASPTCLPQSRRRDGRAVVGATFYSGPALGG